MLKSMKQKFGARRTSTSEKKEPPPPVPQPRQTTTNTASSSKPPPITSRQNPTSTGREKPVIPCLDESTCESYYAELFPAFKTVSGAEKQILFVRKLHLCSFTFDFNDSTKHIREKEIKRQTLVELLDYVSTGSGKFSEAVSEDIIFMVSSNLFRALPPSKAHDQETVDPDEEEPVLDPSWPHLQMVYEILIKYILSNDTDAKAAKKYIDQKFIVRLLELYDCEDPRERDYLKTSLHKIYGKFMVHRPFIRKSINNVFYRFVWETQRHNGIAELLEILGSIINGFALPLKIEHKLFLTRALMPLHKPKCLGMYHQQLGYCVTQFVEKDPKLAEVVLKALLRFWPVTNSQKEVLFLGELEEILEMTQAQEFSKVMVLIFKQVAKCLNSSHFQVAERSLFLWNNEYIVKLVAQQREIILPLIFSALENNASHWNPAVTGLSNTVRKMFQEMDDELYEDCKSRHETETVGAHSDRDSDQAPGRVGSAGQEPLRHQGLLKACGQQAQQEVQEQKRERQWGQLEALASSRQGSRSVQSLQRVLLPPHRSPMFS